MTDFEYRNFCEMGSESAEYFAAEDAKILLDKLKSVLQKRLARLGKQPSQSQIKQAINTLTLDDLC